MAARHSKGAKPKAKQVLASAPAVRKVRISPEMLARSQIKRMPRADQEYMREVADALFARAMPPPGVVPKKDLSKLKMAMDDAMMPAVAWAAGSLYSVAFSQGYAFLGYPYLSELTLVPEYRLISETISTDATRNWIEIQSEEEEGVKKASGGALPEAYKENKKHKEREQKIKDLDAEMKRLNVQAVFRELSLFDGYMGRAHLYFDTGDDTEEGVGSKELLTDIGDGRPDNGATKAKMGKGKLKSIKNVEAVWTYPQWYNALNPLSPDWYRPQMWYAMGKQLHISRMRCMISKPVPDLLKPAFSFGGMSMSQMAKPYVDNWLQTRQSVSDIIQAFSQMILSTDMSGTMEQGGEQVFARAEFMNNVRNNRNLVLVDKDTEDFKNVSAPLGGLSDLQAQAQEHMCVCGDTLVETARGQVPIREMTAADTVMTRKGFAPVKWVGQTGVASELVEITTSRSVLRATKCHPILNSETCEFVSAENVRPLDHLVESRMWESMARPSLGAVAGGARPALATSGTSKVAAFSIASFGRYIADRCRQGWTSITGTMTRRTIVFATSLGSTMAFTWPSMPGAGALALTAMGSHPGRNVPFVERLTSLCIRLARAFAVTDVAYGRVIAACMVRADEAVFNLEVADGYEPEFFANGLLVHNCSPSKIPLVKFTGITPKGLNATTDGEMRSYDDNIHAYQESFFRPDLDITFRFTQINLWGAVDPDLKYIFKPLYEMSDQEKAKLEQDKAKAEKDRIDAGVLDPIEVRQRIKGDTTSGYGFIDADDAPEPPETNEPGNVKEKIGDGEGGDGE